MTKAADDFECIKTALETLDNIYPVQRGEPDAVAAFRRLFTPRPLRELFDQGFRFCWAWHPVAAKVPLYYDMRSNLADDFKHGVWAEMMAVPILRPEDMGIKPYN